MALQYATRWACGLLWAAAFMHVAAAQQSAAARIVLNQQEYFEAPGFSFLLFHNDYQVGYQGGLQMIENGERVLDSGDLLLVPKNGQPSPAQNVVSRVVDRANRSGTVFGELGNLGGYRLICRATDARILITLALDRPIDWSRFQQAGLRLALYPGAYTGHSYQADNTSGVFPPQYTGETFLVPSTTRLRIAQDDPLHTLLVTRPDGPLSLVDPRHSTPQSWFLVFAPLTPGSSEKNLTVEITPAIHPEWRRPPVIAISEAGYHPAQVKRAIIELDPRDASGATVSLYKLEVDRDRKLVKSSGALVWGSFLRYKYETFDFTEIRDPGIYVIESRGVSAGPFAISTDVYREAWKPTLEYFLPIQMCHVAVREGVRTWHSACHLDDARQAPAGKQHIDGYQEQANRETRFADDEHIPGLDWGGWHDAGDFDLPGGSIANTVLYLALAQEEFHPALDETSINRSKREVLLHVPDGQPDLIEQIAYGVEGLLAGYRACGHIFPGIIERSQVQYAHLGDPAGITDDKIDEDDRWAFTNRNTGLQYESVQALAAAYRALRVPNPALAFEALKAAQTIYDYEQQHPPVYAPSAYCPRDSGFRSQELSATAELLLTTADARYRDRLIALLPDLRKASLEQFAAGPGWTLIRALPLVPNRDYRAALLDYAQKWKALGADWRSSNPYDVALPPEISHPNYRLVEHAPNSPAFIWGPGWNLQADAVHQYYLHKNLPELFGAQPLFAVISFVLGCHPASNESYVSGVGANSAMVAYGFNRADWSHIPGGIISGASLIKPDMMELKVFPFLWYQTEYVIGGAASYIFDVLAADKLLNENAQPAFTASRSR